MNTFAPVDLNRISIEYRIPSTLLVAISLPMVSWLLTMKRLSTRLSVTVSSVPAITIDVCVARGI